MAKPKIMKTEPAITIGVIVGALVAIASVFHIVIDPSTAAAVIGSLLPLISAILIRFHVTPAP